MEVVRAESLGMCFGVRDALAVAREVEEPSRVSIHGELVHNPLVLHELCERGFRVTREAEREAIPSLPVVLVTAHGVSDRERDRLAGAGKKLIDTTCPLVERAHRAARELDREGYLVLVVGRRGHVEVEGLVGDLRRHKVVETVSDVRAWGASRIGIVAQTTCPSRRLSEVVREVRRENPAAEIRCVDTICEPTKARQRALDALLGRVDAVVVVGGRNSNNTRQLVARCRASGARACWVQGAADLDPRALDGCRRVGLTAGTSTLDNAIDSVEAALRRMPPSRAALTGTERPPPGRRPAREPPATLPAG